MYSIIISMISINSFYGDLDYTKIKEETWQRGHIRWELLVLPVGHTTSFFSCQATET